MKVDFVGVKSTPNGPVADFKCEVSAMPCTLKISVRVDLLSLDLSEDSPLQEIITKGSESASESIKRMRDF